MTKYVKNELTNLEELLIDQIKLCCTGINSISATDSDLKEAEAIQRLVETIGIIEQMLKQYEGAW